MVRIATSSIATYVVALVPYRRFAGIARRGPSHAHPNAESRSHGHPARREVAPLGRRAAHPLAGRGDVRRGRRGGRPANDRVGDGPPRRACGPRPLRRGSGDRGRAARGRAARGRAARTGRRWATSPPVGLSDGDGNASPVDGAAPTGVVAIAEPARANRTTETAPAAGTAVAGLRRQVFGFLPYWTLSDSTTVLKYDYLSTIAYFSVGADSRGNLLKRNADGSLTTGWGGWTSSRLTSVITAAHQHHTRVVLTVSVFAWTSSQATKQATLLGSSTARLNLARQAAAAVRDRGAD